MSLFVSGSEAQDTGKAYFYSGSYTRHLSADEAAKTGIGLWSVDVKSGALTREAGPWILANPTFQALTADKRYLYSVNEVGDYKGKKDGSLTMFSVDASTRGLKKLGTISANGPIPAYLSVDATGRHLITANYSGANVCVYPINADGTLGDATANIHHTGSSVDAGRQQGPHPHSAVLSPDNQYVYVADLGLDLIKTYAFDAKGGTLTPAPKLDVVTLPGTGPRHLVFHPSGKFAFCSLEMGNRLVSYRYADGQLTKVGDYGTVPEDMQGKSYTSEVRVSPNGKFVYIANRGHNSIAVFKLDESTGALKRIQLQSVEGDWPRNFAIDPGGTMMVVANQKSDNLVSFHVNPETGLLTPTRYHVPKHAPMYICFTE